MKLSEPYLHDPIKDAIKYKNVKPVFDKKRTDLSGYIRDSRNKDANLIPRNKINNMLRTQEAVENPYRTNVQINRNLKTPKPRKLSSRKNNNFFHGKIDPVTLESPSQPQDQNNSLFLPDVGYFKQNLPRPDDMEVEERALANMYNKDFDDLKLLQMLSANPDLYNHKLQQYKEVSQSRIEAEKRLQQQRLDKIKRDFDKQIYEEEVKRQQDKWTQEQSVSTNILITIYSVM